LTRFARHVPQNVKRMAAPASSRIAGFGSIGQAQTAQSGPELETRPFRAPARTPSGKLGVVIDQLASDMMARPSLFQWRTPISIEDPSEWAADAGLVIPDALISLWSATCGGEFFETEELLASLGYDPGEGVLQRSAELEHLIRPGAVVVHEGWLLTTLTADGELVAHDQGFGGRDRHYASLVEWYAEIRAEYAERYGLPL